MREIKFRQWTGLEFHYWGFGVSNDGAAFAGPASNTRVKVDEGHQQYTGLKDCNGVEIYEGDVVKLGRGIAVVSFNDDNYGGVMGWNLLYTWGEAYEHYYGRSPGNDCEVIGNIYEHPHLLEVDK